MVSDTLQTDTGPVLLGQFPPSFRREHPREEPVWKDVHHADMDIGADQTHTHHISIVEQTSESTHSPRRVIIRLTQITPDNQPSNRHIEMPLGDFLQQEYWHSDSLGGRITLLSQDPIDFGMAVRTMIRKQKGEYPFEWLQDGDLRSTYQQAEQYFRGNARDNRVADITISPTQKLYIHTHVCRPTRIDRASENPYIRQGYRAITVNITEVINPDDPPEKHVYKRIHISDKEKLLPMEFPISEWEMHADGYRDAIRSKIPRLPESDVNTIFAHLESNIATLRAMK